jgi:hypothetical protein
MQYNNKISTYNRRLHSATSAIYFLFKLASKCEETNLILEATTTAFLSILSSLVGSREERDVSF